MKASTPMQFKILDYLRVIAEQDELFAKTFAKENKNIDECCNYIISEVKKSGKYVFDDQEIFDMALHYYDEDDIKVTEKHSCKVVVTDSNPDSIKAMKTMSKPDKKDAKKQKEPVKETKIPTVKATANKPISKPKVKPKEHKANMIFIQGSLF